MHVLVLGARSQTGVATVPRLLAAGHRVDALTRSPPAAEIEGLRWHRGALPAGSPTLAPRYDALLSLGPLDACTDWLERAAPDCPRWVALGSVSVVSKADSPDPEERRLAAALAAAETGFQAQARRRGASALLLRPTMIYGAGLDRNLTALARLAARLRLLPFPLLFGAGGVRQPLHVDDLAAALLAALARPAVTGVLAVPGPALHWWAIFGAIAASLGVVRVRVPMALARLACGLRGDRLGTAMLARFCTDQIADDSAARAALGHAARPFRPTAATWQPRHWPIPC